jgi:hypothetical protein
MDQRQWRSRQHPWPLSRLPRSGGRRPPARPRHPRRITGDIDTRTQLYRQAQVLFKQEAPWVVMNDSMAFMVVRDRVENFKIYPFGGVYFYGVDIGG